MKKVLQAFLKAKTKGGYDRITLKDYFVAKRT
jgi:hypothetical protein